MRHIEPSALVLVASVLALCACGGGVLAPEGPQSNAFLNKISANCGKLRIGDQPIDYLLSVDSNDDYFIDEASKLSAGEIDKATFTEDINGFYPTDSNQPALACIFAQMGGR